MTADPNLDQLHAAANHARKAVTTAADLLPTDYVRSFGEIDLSGQSPVHVAVRRWAGKTYQCGHLGIQPGFGILREPGRAYCARCLPAAISAYMAKDSDRCDTCNQPNEVFHELTIQVGPAILLANVCRECMRAHEEASRG